MNDCIFCDKDHDDPKYRDSLKFKEDHNEWDNLRDVVKVLSDKEWAWCYNMHYKYINVRIDMRDGGCIIMDNNGKRISPRQLARQHPDPPVSDEEAYANPPQRSS